MAFLSISHHLPEALPVISPYSTCGTGAREHLKVLADADGFQEEVLLDIYEDLIGYAQSLRMSSRKTAVMAWP